MSLSGLDITAVAAANDRALECTASEPLFRDDVARQLVEVVKKQDPPETLDWISQGKSIGDWIPALQGFVSIRTAFFDRELAEAVDRGICQVVVVGLGLDTRPFRAFLPKPSVVYGIDKAEMLDARRVVLDLASIEEASSIVPVPGDLEDDWTVPLTARGFDPTLQTLWMMEAILMYLSRGAVQRLLSLASSLSTPGSEIAIDHTFGSPIERKDFRRARRVLPNLSSLQGDGTASPASWMRSVGWSGGSIDSAAFCATLGRELPGCLTEEATGSGFWFGKGSKS